MLATIFRTLYVLAILRFSSLRCDSTSLDEKVDKELRLDEEAFSGMGIRLPGSDKLQNGMCPSPNLIVPAEDLATGNDTSCLAGVNLNCTSDSDCSSSDSNLACCFDGCTFACLEKMPVTVIDWEEEKSIKTSDISELESDEFKEADGGFGCVTSFRAPGPGPSCPVGYRCEVRILGDPIAGTPHRGVCVPESTSNPGSISSDDKTTQKLSTAIDDDDDEEHVESAHTGETVFLKGGCLLTSYQYSHIEDFLKEKHFASCECVEGSVQCRVRTDEQSPTEETIK